MGFLYFTSEPKTVFVSVFFSSQKKLCYCSRKIGRRGVLLFCTRLITTHQNELQTIRTSNLTAINHSSLSLSKTYVQILLWMISMQFANHIVSSCFCKFIPLQFLAMIDSNLRAINKSKSPIWDPNQQLTLLCIGFWKKELCGNTILSRP